jgi:CRP/FNR family cyclic AMP-dependent transcriptional regulator
MGEQELADALGRVPLFEAVPKKDLQRLARSFSGRTFAPGREIVVEGSRGIGFFVIESGEAAVTRQGEEIRQLGPGDWFGEMALIDQGPRSATVVARSELRCHAMTPWSFRPVVEAHGEIAWPLLETLVARLRETETGPGGEDR